MPGMPNVPVLIGQAPTSGSTLRERLAAEKAGYLIDRGDHLEWHRDRKAWLWALPGRPIPDWPGLHEGRLRTSSPGKKPAKKSARVTPVRMRGFVLDSPGLAAVLAGATPAPVPASVRWWLARRMTGRILAVVALSVLLLAIIALAFLADGANFDLGGGGSGKTKGKGPHLYLLDERERVLGAVSDFDPDDPRNRHALGLLAHRGVRFDLGLPVPPGPGGPGTPRQWTAPAQPPQRIGLDGPTVRDVPFPPPQRFPS
jgi:hypothetical protein